MRRYIKLLGHPTVRNKFNIIIALIIGMLAFSLVNFWVSMNITSGIRAYVGGEGLWSKAQKASVNNLVRYSTSQDQADYDRYLHFLQVPLGDKQARLELNKSNPNRDIIKQGFVRGGNKPEDVNNMIFLYRRFHSISYMDSAIKIWAQADAEIVKLMSLGEQLHAVNSAPLAQNDPRAQAAKNAKVATILQQVYANDTRSTLLENDFSATLGNGSRAITKVLTEITILSTTLLGLLIIVIAVLIAKTIIRLDKVKTEFISLTSHQLRTPLVAINWYAEALLAQKHDKLSAEQQERLSELYKGSRRMTRLINDILNVSSLDLGIYNPEPKSFNTKEVLRTILKDLQPVIDQKDIRLVTNVASDAQKIKLDQVSLTAILQNLLSNSVKYTQPGGKVEVSITIDKAKLLLRVADSGVGIPKSQQSQVFTKFFTATNTKALGSDHTGLGLYIVQSMVDRLGGKIRFDSLEDIGTSFYITLPLHEHLGE